MSHTFASRCGSRSAWTSYVVDRLFALRDWLAESPDRAKRRNRPVLDMLLLERREMPAVVVTMNAEPHIGGWDDFLEYGVLGYVHWVEGDDPTVMINWGEGSPEAAQRVDEYQDIYGRWHAGLYGQHDYDRAGDPTTAWTDYTFQLVGTGENPPSRINRVKQGQHIDIFGPGDVDEDAGTITVTASLSVGNPFTLEGRSVPPTRTVSVQYFTDDGSSEANKAEGSKDFRSKSGMIEIPAYTEPGVPFTITLDIIDDEVLDRADIENFRLVFHTPVNADLGLDNNGVPILRTTLTLGIIDDDYAIPRFVRRRYNAFEPGGAGVEPAPAVIGVELQYPAEREVTVVYRTVAPSYPYANDPPYKPASGGALPLPPSHLPQPDFIEVEDTLTFPAFTKKLTFDVLIVGDNLRERSEYVGLELDYPFGEDNIYLGPEPNPPTQPVQRPPYRKYANLRIIDKDNRLIGDGGGGGAGGGGGGVSQYEADLYDWLFPDTPFAYNPVNGTPVADVSLLVCNPSGDCGRFVVQELTDVLPFYVDPRVRYNANTKQQKPAVWVNMDVPAGVATPTSIIARLVFDGVPQAEVSYSLSGFTAGQTYAFGVALDQFPTESGVYDYSLEIEASFSDGTVDDFVVEGKKVVVARNAAPTGSPPPPKNPYGNGWDIAGVDRLYVRYDALLVDSTGRPRVFLADDVGGGFKPEVGEFGSLVEKPDGTFEYTTPDQTLKVFDADGKLRQQIDRHGLTIHYNYDSLNRLSTTLDPDGRLATYVYDTNGYLDKIYQPGPRITDVDIASNGDLTRIVDAEGGIQTFTYDSAGRLKTESYGPRTVTLGYDSLGLLQTVDQGGGTVTTVTAVFGALLGNSTGRPLVLASTLRATVTDAEQGKTTMTMDIVGRLAKLETPDGATRSWSYDANGRLDTAIDPLGGRTVYQYATYDDVPSADVARVTYADGTFATFTYHSELHQLTGQTVTGIDAGDIRRTTITLNAYGDPVSIHAADNSLTTLTWGTNNRVGLVEAVTRRDAGPSLAVTSYGYDTNRRLTTVTDPSGGVTTYLYDTAWNLRTVTDPLGNTTTTVYDLMRRLETVTDAESRTTTYFYNAPGWLVGEIDAAGTRTSYVYDGRGWLTTVTNAVDTSLVRTTAYRYDLIGRPVKMTDPLNRATTYAYNTANRTVTTTDPLLGVATAVYDRAGQLVESMDPLNRLTTYVYDPRGRVRAAVDPLERVARLRSDAAGNVTHVRAPTELTGSDTLKVNQTATPGSSSWPRPWTGPAARPCSGSTRSTAATSTCKPGSSTRPAGRSATNSALRCRRRGPSTARPRRPTLPADSWSVGPTGAPAESTPARLTPPVRR